MRLRVGAGDEGDVRGAGEDLEEALDAGFPPELRVVVHVEEVRGGDGVDDGVAAELRVGGCGWVGELVRGS